MESPPQPLPLKSVVPIPFYHYSRKSYTVFIMLKFWQTPAAVVFFYHTKQKVFFGSLQCTNIVLQIQAIGKDIDRRNSSTIDTFICFQFTYFP